MLPPISIPVSVAFGSYLIKRGEEERARGNQNEQTLQRYLDKIFEIQSGSHESGLSESEKELIRAKTSSVLQVLKKDATRKGRVIRFLIDSNTISKIDMDLEGMELSETNLEGLDLSGINLRGSTLIRAILSERLF